MLRKENNLCSRCGIKLTDDRFSWCLDCRKKNNERYHIKLKKQNG